MIDIKELQALINLLDDPDEDIYSVIENKIIKIGHEVIPYLEEAWESSASILFQDRIERIIDIIQFSSVKNNLTEWVNNNGENLLYGAYLISKFQYPDLEYAAIEKIVDNIKKDVWLELNDNLTALEKVSVLNHIVFNIHNYTKNSTNFYSPQNSYINNVLESKKGNPVTLAIVYATIAQMMGLPIYGVNLPKNFILAYKDEVTAIEAFGIDDNDFVLFYINPYNKGTVFGKKEIEFFIKQQKLENKKSYYIPCSNTEIIFLLISNLIEAYEKLGYPDKIKKLKEMLEIVKL